VKGGSDEAVEKAENRAVVLHSMEGCIFWMEPLEILAYN
jgi:hypothetical protein